MSKKTKTDPAPERDIFAETLALQSTLAASATQFQARVLEQTAGFTFDIFDFMNQRLNNDIAAARALGQCTTVEDAFERLGEFQKKALEDYTCETARLSARGTYSADVLREAVAEDAEKLSRAVKPKAA